MVFSIGAALPSPAFSIKTSIPPHAEITLEIASSALAGSVTSAAIIKFLFVLPATIAAKSLEVLAVSATLWPASNN